MVDPFPNIRRKVGTATYGRKALAARRAAASAISFQETEQRNRGIPETLELVSPQVKKHTPLSPSLTDVTDNDSDDKAFNSPHEEDGITSDKMPWVHRTAQTTISRLEALYEATKSDDVVVYASDDGDVQGINVLHTPVVLNSAKDKWDLDEQSCSKSKQIGVKNQAKGTTTQKQKRVVLNNTDVFVDIVKPRPKRLTKSQKAAAPTTRQDTKPSTVQKQGSSIKTRRSSTRNSQTKRDQLEESSQHSDSRLKRARSLKNTKPDKHIARDNSYPNSSENKLEADTLESPQKISRTASMRPPRPAIRHTSTQKQGGDSAKIANNARSEGRWSMKELLSSARSLERTKSQGRKIKERKSKCLTSRSCSSEQCISSPPSTPTQLIGHSSDIDSDKECTAEPLNQTHTPISQVNNRRILDTINGPSSATSKRLQKRAYSQNVVYTYGKTRDEFLDSEFNQFFQSAGLLGYSNRMLSGSDSETDLGTQESQMPHSQNHRSISSELSLSSCGHCAGSIDQSSGNAALASETLRLQIDRITQMIGGTFDEQIAACQDLVAILAEEELCNELLESKYWITMLTQSFIKEQKTPIVLATTIILITVSFSNPSTMQVLVFDRQILEVVAEAIKSSFVSDILLLRLRDDFSSYKEFKCVKEICRCIRSGSLIPEELPISMYTISLVAIHSFTNVDDAAYLAMAGLLRSELRDSGCLALVSEKSFTWSIPRFNSSINNGLVHSPELYSLFDNSCSKLHQMQPNKGDVDSDVGSSSNDDDDDMWMDFDLPEEKADKGRFIITGTHNQKKKVSDRVQIMMKKAPNSQFMRFSFANEPGPEYNSRAVIDLELDVLRFCISSSSENQFEIFKEKLCVSSSIELLATCQRVMLKSQGKRLSMVLGTAVLLLQFFVNLSNDSPEFSARFSLCGGLELATKNLVLAQKFLNKSRSTIGSLGETHEMKDVFDFSYDILLNTTALLTNIVEASGSAALQFSYVLQSLGCTLDQKCTPKCTCINRISLTNIITQAFTTCHKMSEGDSSVRVAAGYLSVLLGFILRECPSTRPDILKHIPDGDSSCLIMHIEQFVQLSDAISKRFGALLGINLFRPGGTRINQKKDSARISNGSNNGGSGLELERTLRNDNDAAHYSSVAESLGNILDFLRNTD